MSSHDGVHVLSAQRVGKDYHQGGDFLPDTYSTVS